MKSDVIHISSDGTGIAAPIAMDRSATSIRERRLNREAVIMRRNILRLVMF